MLSYQIREYYEFALNELEEFEKSIRMLLEYEVTYREISLNTLTKILALARKGINGDSASYTVKDAELINVFNSLNIELVSKFNIMPAFVGYADYKRKVMVYKSDNNIVDSDTDNLFEQIESLFESYQSYIQSQNDRAKAVVFMQQLITFRAYYYAVKTFYINAVDMFKSSLVEDDSQENCAVMEIQLLEVSFTFEEFVKHLSSIQKIYTELNQVMHTEGAVNSLEIVKIESGSLLARVLGDNNVLEAIGLLLTKTINLCFTKFTKGGQLQTNSEVRQQILDDLELRDELTKRGFDLSSSDEHITKAFNLVTKETLRLASATPRFKINGEVLACRDFDSQKYIEENKTKLLTDCSESQD